MRSVKPRGRARIGFPSSAVLRLRRILFLLHLWSSRLSATSPACLRLLKFSSIQPPSRLRLCLTLAPARHATNYVPSSFQIDSKLLLDLLQVSLELAHVSFLAGPSHH
jgi:hypothetical protein